MKKKKKKRLGVMVLFNGPLAHVHQIQPFPLIKCLKSKVHQLDGQNLLIKILFIVAPNKNGNLHTTSLSHHQSLSNSFNRHGNLYKPISSFRIKDTKLPPGFIEYCESWSTQELQRQFIEDLGIPSAWMHEALAIYFLYYGDLPKALEHFLDCFNWQRAHSIFVTSVAHSLFSSYKHSEIWRLATTMEEHSSEIADWDLGAGIYIDFYTIKSYLYGITGEPSLWTFGLRLGVTKFRRAKTFLGIV
ncbi:nuclear pore complex protein NUP96 [Cinnamomum micranthum f. kanehirae]|uniref:Nuclear pore complex protein NUP96 n=1 Tax=Cinnamomum micranthum f. kanehirae TaxID=337451 RepID=A0A443NWU9_9MAGN|nr:nuclear pore complex protein NUP96 [Cinnamomum micranthum f. kanehirae]